MTDRLTKEELAELLRTPLDPDLDYFDATASIEALSNHVRGLHKLINTMFESLALQGRSIIDLRREIVEIKGDLLAAGVNRKEPDSGLVGFGKKTLEIN